VLYDETGKTHQVREQRKVVAGDGSIQGGDTGELKTEQLVKGTR